MNTKTETLKNKIKQLVDVSASLLKWSEEYKYLYDKYRPSDNSEYTRNYANEPIPTLLRFQSTLMFFDVVLNINSLLSPIKQDPDKKEASFLELLEFLPQSNEKDQMVDLINNIRKMFLDNKLDKIRNKFVGHKDLNLKYDPMILYLNFPNPDLVDVCKNIVNSLTNICLNYLCCIRNNEFDQFYKKSHQKYLEIIEKSLTELRN